MEEQQGKLVMVVDTNVLLSNGFPLVQELIQRGLCTIFLPWQVLQELDRHKSGLETAVQARSVVRWISRLLEANQRGLATQSLRDQRRAMRLHLDQGSRGPDDRILASCLLLANEASAVTLLTDDINLANKARANGLRVATSSNVRTELSGGLDSHSRPVKEGYLCQGGKYHQGGEAAQGQGRARENFQKESEVARGAIRHLLDVVLMEEFKEAYGDPLWKQVVAVPPAPTSPHWDLDTLFRLYKKHHIAVFSLAFPPSGRELEESLDRLQKCSKTGKDLNSAIMQIVEVVGKKSNYSGLVKSTKGVLEQLKSEPGPNSTTTVADFFNLAWQQIATSTSNYARAYQVECSLQAVQSNVGGTLQPPFDQVASLLASVSGLQEALAASVSDPNRSNLQNLQFRLAELSFGSDVSSTTTGVEELRRWMGDNPGVVTEGLCQIEGVRTILAACLAKQMERH